MNIENKKEIFQLIQKYHKISQSLFVTLIKATFYLNNFYTLKWSDLSSGLVMYTYAVENNEKIQILSNFFFHCLYQFTLYC